MLGSFRVQLRGIRQCCLAESGPRGPKLNPTIHSAKDTIEMLDMEFLSKFVKLGMAFVIEYAGTVQE